MLGLLKHCRVEATKANVPIPITKAKSHPAVQQLRATGNGCLTTPKYTKMSTRSLELVSSTYAMLSYP